MSDHDQEERPRDAHRRLKIEAIAAAHDPEPEETQIKFERAAALAGLEHDRQVLELQTFQRIADALENIVESLARISEAYTEDRGPNGWRKRI